MFVLAQVKLWLKLYCDRVKLRTNGLSYIVIGH